MTQPYIQPVVPLTGFDQNFAHFAVDVEGSWVAVAVALDRQGLRRC